MIYTDDPAYFENIMYILISNVVFQALGYLKNIGLVQLQSIRLTGITWDNLKFFFIFISAKVMFKRCLLDIITDVSEITWDDPEYFENRAIINAHLDEDGKKLAHILFSYLLY